VYKKMLLIYAVVRAAAGPPVSKSVFCASSLVCLTVMGNRPPPRLHRRASPICSKVRNYIEMCVLRITF